VLRADGLTDKGWVRPSNEDHFAVDEGLRLCVVADGMGGHRAGEVAARVAVEAIVDYIGELRPILSGDVLTRGAETNVVHPFGFDPSLTVAGNLIRTAIHLANIQVLEAASSSDEYAGMGTTIVVAFVVDDHLSVGHVGDSRLYRLSGSGLRRLTDDDSWMASVLEHDPKADPMVLQHHPLRNALTNVVGGRSCASVHVVEERLTEGDLLLLTTDGVHGVIDDRRLEQLLTGGGDAANIASRVVESALRRGSRDNCTAVVAKYLPD
jgi:protein phosphatase